MALTPTVGKFAVRTLVVAASILLSTGISRADKGHKLNQDQVLQGVNSGEIKPLAEVLAVAAKAVPGRVIRVEIERKHGRVVYELKILMENGRVRECYIDAATLEILKVE